MTMTNAPPDMVWMGNGAYRLTASQRTILASWHDTDECQQSAMRVPHPSLVGQTGQVMYSMWLCNKCGAVWLKGQTFDADKLEPAKLLGYRIPPDNWRPPGFDRPPPGTLRQDDYYGVRHSE